MIKKLKGRPFLTALFIGIFLWLLFIGRCIIDLIVKKNDFDLLFAEGLFGILLIIPAPLFIGEFLSLISVIRGNRLTKEASLCFDIITCIFGYLYELIYMNFVDEVIFSDWHVQLYNSEVHSPIFTESFLSLSVIMIVSAAGYALWTLKPLKKTPPLLSVLCIGATYMGIILNIVFTVQYFRSVQDFPMLILPACLLMMTARTILLKVREWKEYDISPEKISKNSFLNACNNLLSDSGKWPWLGLIAMLPLLGIIIGVLMLFGQAPDSVVKAFTETADWNLSQMEAPQNLVVDEHYLCTVAAGGHKKVVKPQRYGVRHGHRVIVNRQLCIANAFEQILEERTPKFHKKVRHFYDTYGFPIAKLIKTKTAADIVYFIMKPLEWIFLIVLYLTDVKPENRIAVQYMGRV